MITATIPYAGRNYVLESLSPIDCIYKIWLDLHVFYEYQILEEIKKRNRKGIYVDVGANVGNHSVFFATQCPCDKLIAIESCPEIRDCLERNLRRNIKISPQCDIYNCAILDRDTKVIIIPSNMESIGGTRVQEDQNGPIIARTLDNLLINEQNIAVLKIDVEGYEIEVLRGAKNLIAKNKPIIVCESLDVNTLNSVMTNEIKYKATTFDYCKDRGWAPTFIFDHI